MGRLCESALLVLGLLVLPPLDARVASKASSMRATAVVPTSDYIFLDGFEPAADCSPRLSCPAPVSGKSCVSGWLTDAGSGSQLRALFRADLTCSEGAIGGPCDLSVRAYDAVQFGDNPDTATPLAASEVTVDGCGRFRFANLQPPPLGFVAIATDDAPGSNTYATTGTFHALGTNVKLDDVNILATRNDTAAQWTVSAGSPFGASSFADVGAILLYFTASGIPRAGVTVLQNASTVAANDYYFSDASPLLRLNIDSAQSSTGPDGSALFVNGTLTNYSGAGAEPMGCTWPSRPAVAIPGVVVFVEIDC
jgi:hypothetical protein